MGGFGVVPGGTASLQDIITGFGAEKGAAESAQLQPDLIRARTAQEQQQVRVGQMQEQAIRRQQQDADILSRAYVNTTGDPREVSDYLRRNGISGGGYQSWMQHSMKMREDALKLDEAGRKREMDLIDRAGTIVDSLNGIGDVNAARSAYGQYLPQLQQLAPDVQWKPAEQVAPEDFKFYSGILGHAGKLIGYRKDAAAAEQAEFNLAQDKKLAPTKETHAVADSARAVADAEYAKLKLAGKEPTQPLDLLKIEADAVDRAMRGRHERRMEELTLRGQNITAQGQQIQAAGQAQQIENHRAQVAGQLRDDLRQDTKDFPIIARGYGQIQQAKDGKPVSDMTLLYAYLKMVDPGSTVREGERADAQNAGGVPSWVVSQYNKLIGGGRLESGLRQQFIDQGTKIYQQSKADADKIAAKYREIAVQNGVNPEHVIIPKDSTAGAQPAAAGGMVRLQAPDGSVKEVPADQADHYVQRGAKRL